MKAKAFLLTLFLSVAAVSLWAQEKYEYAVLKKTVNGVFLKTETGTQGVPFEKGEDKDAIQLKKLSELTSQGWEIFSVTENTEGGSALASTVSYHLRKKKN